jgi:hypothetical protein
MSSDTIQTFALAAFLFISFEDITADVKAAYGRANVVTCSRSGWLAGAPAPLKGT